MWDNSEEDTNSMMDIYHNDTDGVGRRSVVATFQIVHARRKGEEFNYTEKLKTSSSITRNLVIKVRFTPPRQCIHRRGRVEPSVGALA